MFYFICSFFFSPSFFFLVLFVDDFFFVDMFHFRDKFHWGTWVLANKDFYVGLVDMVTFVFAVYY